MRVKRCRIKLLWHHAAGTSFTTVTSLCCLILVARKYMSFCFTLTDVTRWELITNVKCGSPAADNLLYTQHFITWKHWRSYKMKKSIPITQDFRDIKQVYDFVEDTTKRDLSRYRKRVGTALTSYCHCHYCHYQISVARHPEHGNGIGSVSLFGDKFEEHGRMDFSISIHT